MADIEIVKFADKPLEKRDYLFYFTDIYFSEVVKETIFLENWENKDFDHRYPEYVKEFLDIKDKCFIEEGTIEGLKQRLSVLKNEVLNRFSKKMKKLFLNELKKRGCNEEMADQLLPKDILINEKINTNILITFRELEERVYTQNQGEI
ncbi:MAG: hypothetical protein LBH44_00295 [Treponema sp.]|jgi:hypothetical protein|nr:hypothetical protein [Treponema sp.]